MIQKEYYEPRYVSRSNHNSMEFSFGGKKEKKTLYDLIIKFDKIVLLGNPGIGKTKELENLFEVLWREHETTGLIPFSINLKNFRLINIFEDLISYKEWKNLPRIIFILDGLDEISEIQDFISAFEIFVSKNNLFNIKYVISCRTNIYEKYLVNISNFETFFLDNLMLEQAKSILNEKYKINLDSISIDDKHRNYLQTPFFLNLFAEYYLKNQKTPQSDSEMWEKYIEKTIEENKTKNIKKKVINNVKLIKDLKKVAFVNELMQKNFSTEDELDTILGENHLEFIENPFSGELKSDKKKWNFEHRQIQEYFVAKTLSEKSIEEIISIIKIPNTKVNAIHPSLFNTITFLINLLDKDSDKFKKLIDWIKNNQIELLIKADSDRTNNFKKEVFQYYFNSECIEKKFWINTNRIFSKKEIGDFGNCEANFDYLLEKINTKTNHFRIIISALELLCFFTIPLDKKESLKSNFIDLLKNDNTNKSIKSHIVEFIHAQNLAKEDKKYFDEIFELFRTETHKELNLALLSLIDNDAVDEMFWFIKAEFLLENNIEKREIPDDVHRGTNWFLNEMILNLKLSNNFIEIIHYYLRDEISRNLDNLQLENILNKFILFDEIEDDFMIRFMDKLNLKIEFRLNDMSILQNFILKSKPKSQYIASEYLLNSYPFSEIDYFLSSISNYETIRLVMEKYKKGEIDKNEEIEIYRNMVGYRENRKLGKEFNNLMIVNGFEFTNEYWTEDKVIEENVKLQKRIQNNFDILFDKKQLLKEIKTVFNLNGETINENLINTIEHKWYESNGWNNKIDTYISLLNSLIRKAYKALNFQEIEEILEEDSIIFKEIKMLIDGNKKSNFLFEVSKSQKQEIEDWSIKTAQNLDFKNILQVTKHDSFSMLPGYEILKLILFFQNEFDFSLTQEFQLNTIEFFEVEKSHSINQNFEKLIERINDKKLVDERIILNLKEVTLFSFSLSKHIEYALNNNLIDVLPEIRNYFLQKSSLYVGKKEIEKYIKLVNGNTDILKELSQDIKEHKSWDAIGLLMKMEVEKKYCISKAIECLETENQNNYNFKSAAISILFQLDQKIAVENYYNLLENNFESSLKEYCYTNYKEIEEYDILEKLFRLIYNPSNSERRIYSGATSFLTTYVCNLSKDDDSYNKVVIILKKLKKEFEIEKNDSNVFYINLLIESSNNSYINSKSKALNFNEALKKVEELLV